MKHSTRLAFLCALGLSLGAAACGDSDATGSGASGGGESTTTAAAGGGAATVTYSGQINEITASGSVPLGDVELCAESHPDVACVMADASGAYTWPGLPANAEVSMRTSKADYLDATTFLVTGTENVDDFNGGSVSRATVDLLYSLIGEEYDATKGSIALTIVTPELDDQGMPTGDFVGITGATATMTPNSGVGPVYASDAGIPNTSLTSTGEDGTVFWANANPGEITIGGAADGMTCTLGRYGWPASDGIARGVINADSASFLEILCE